MSDGQIGYSGQTQLQPNMNLAQNGSQSNILRTRNAIPLSLMPGQVFILPAGDWQVSIGKYSTLQWYDTNAATWRNAPNSPGYQGVVQSDGTNARIANTTGCPVGAVITNVGAGNATNGFNTIGVTISAGNSTWNTLVGGSVNVNVNVTTAGNYGLPPLLVWTPAANQTLPYRAPQFNCTIQANGNIATVSVLDQGAGLTAVGTINIIQQVGDTNPGGGVVNIGGNALANSGNLTALWPATPGQNGNVGLQSVPTFTFNIGGGLAATAIMNFAVTGAANASNQGANYGTSQPIVILAANGVANVSANAQVANTVNDFELWSPPRMAWLSGNSAANGTVNNQNVVVVDSGYGFQAIPLLAVFAGNSGIAANISQAVLTAQVGGINDMSYIQAI